MEKPPRHRLSDVEKDALLLEQTARISTPPVSAALAKQGLTSEFCVARHRADANELQTSWLTSVSRF